MEQFSNAQQLPTTNQYSSRIYVQYLLNVYLQVLNKIGKSKNAVNLKWPKWGSLEILKLVILHAQLEK